MLRGRSFGGEILYIYPENLVAKATLWLWELRDLGVLGIGLLLSLLALVRLGWFLPLVVTALFGFLTIRLTDASILDFIRYAVGYFFLRPQIYEWRTAQ